MNIKFTFQLVICCLVFVHLTKAQSSLPPKDSLLVKEFTVLPYNTESNRVSVVEVIKVDSVKQEDIYKRIFDWYKNRSTTILLPEDFSKKKDPNGKAELAGLYVISGADPAYTSIKSFEKISLQVSIYNLKDIKGAFAPKEMSGFEIANLTILIKDGRYKVELTNFRHQIKYVRPVTYSREGVILDYEMKKADFSESNWNTLRLEGLNKMYKVLIDLSDFIRKNPNGDMNF